MQQIADWLKKLGLSEYAQCFVENGISLAALPHLTDQDLKEIGVLLGHRRIMLAAISELASAAAPVTSQPAAPPAEPRDDAERRQLTVMFCDLVGSTALSTKLDPEDMRSVIGAYHKCVSETVARFDGFVAKYMGDCWRATHPPTLFLLPAAHGQRALPDHWPDGTCCRAGTRCHSAREARQAR